MRNIQLECSGEIFSLIVVQRSAPLFRQRAIQ
jgi:hypothetical protein